MRKMTVLKGSVSLFLLLATSGALFVTSVAASQEVIMVSPMGYPTIQAAIDAADPGDTILVPSGTYYEHVVINKSLTIVGKSSSTTIIDGNGTGIVVRVNAPDVEIRGFTVQNSGDFPNSSILLGGCVRNTIRGNIIRNNNACGITLIGSDDGVIVGNKIMNNSWAGIVIKDSSNNIIHYNMIANNSIGVWITSNSSLFNTFYHNNFIDNHSQVQSFACTTRWDNGAEGNYWSDYAGVDADGDGIGDTGYPNPEFPLDNYPLMEPWSPYRVFSVTKNEVTYYVTTFSNSTLASFSFSHPLRQISFKVTSGASGFCNVTIPKELLYGYFMVLIDNEKVLPPSLTLTENATHTSFHFTDLHSTHDVEILGRGDVNDNGIIDELDMLLVALAFRSYDPAGDLNNDGLINVLDLLLCKLNLGT